MKGIRDMGDIKEDEGNVNGYGGSTSIQEI